MRFNSIFLFAIVPTTISSFYKEKSELFPNKGILKVVVVTENHSKKLPRNKLNGNRKAERAHFPVVHKEDPGNILGSCFNSNTIYIHELTKSLSVDILGKY